MTIPYLISENRSTITIPAQGPVNTDGVIPLTVTA